jgi:hypothetical protein
MRIRTAAVTAAVTGLFLAVGPSAWAASEIGSNCSAADGAQGYTLLTLEKGAENPLSLTAPSSGVITSWRVNNGLTVGGYGERLKVFRPTGAPNAFQAVGESGTGTVAIGQNVFASRVPIQAGDRIGATALAENEAVFYCEASASVPVGTTQTFPPIAPGVELALSAVVEPDADGDGYGDETQDKCPQSASTQAECPVIVLDTYPLAKRSAIVVVVASSQPGPVSVSGSAKLPKSAKKASASAKAKLKTVTMDVAPGKLVRFKLKLPASLRSALRGLPSGKSITVSLKATASNVAGQASVDKSKVKLKGVR